MKGPRVEFALWVLATVAVVIAFWRWDHGRLASASPRISVPAVEQNVARAGPAALTRAARTVTRRNPFRIDRRPSAVPFSSEPQPAVVSSPSVGFTPVLVGIVGPPYQAILSGIPGRNGEIVLRQGDTLASLHVRRLTADSMILVAPDTIWRLSVRRAWQ